MTGMRCAASVVIFVLVQVAIVRDTVGRAMQLSRPNAGFHVMGVSGGGIDCGDMTNNLRNDRQSWGLLYASYTRGFITGANFVSYLGNVPQNTNVGYDIPPEVMFGSVEQYCQQNPFKKIHEAVESVYSGLAGR